MGLFDAVRSLFGSDAADEERDGSRTDADETRETDVPPAESSADEPDERPTTDSTDDDQLETPDEPASEPTAEESRERFFEEAATAEELVAGGETAEGTEAESESDDASTIEDESDDASAGETDTDGEEEKISWEETGFEQLTTELVEDDEDDDDDAEDATDLIQEAESDWDDSEQSVGSGVDAADESELAGDAETATARADEGPETGRQNLPLDEDEAATMTGDSGHDTDVDVPDDSPRAEFVEEAVELAEFWSEYDLDVTVESLSRLDDLLEEQWGDDRFEDAEYGGDDYDSEVFTGLVTQIGSYLGEVFVRVHGGEWVHQEGVGWTVDVPAGPGVEAAGATVTVFYIAQECLTGEATVVGKHDALAAELGLDETVREDSTTSITTADVDAVTAGADDRENGREDAVERLREGAEDLADRWPDYDLDFSTASLGRLDDLLAAELDDERFVDAELGDETDRDSMLLTAHAVGVGGYLAEVLRREHDATWETEQMVLVVDTAGGETTIDPIDVAVECIRGERSLTEVVPEA